MDMKIVEAFPIVNFCFKDGEDMEKYSHLAEFIYERIQQRDHVIAVVGYNNIDDTNDRRMLQFNKDHSVDMIHAEVIYKCIYSIIFVDYMSNDPPDRIDPNEVILRDGNDLLINTELLKGGN